MPLFLQLDQVLHDLLDRHRRVYTGDLVDVNLFLGAEGGMDPVEVCSEVFHAAVTRSHHENMIWDTRRFNFNPMREIQDIYTCI